MSGLRPGPSACAAACLLALSLLAVPAGVLPLAAQTAPVATQATPAAPTPPEALPSQPGLGATPQVAPVTDLQAVHADLWPIVLRAHPVVQAVMALLAAMAFLVATTLLYKSIEIARADRRLRQSLALVLGGAPLETLAPGLPRAPEAGAAMVRLALAELDALPPALGAIEAEGLRERCRIGLARVEATALHRLRSGVGLLAQIAATAPFIGLFGTVFGIMNAFLAIAATKTTSLSVVAPGIAEALLATAVGLAAAIPAVLTYNLLNRRIAVFRHRLGDVTAQTERLLSREIDRRRLAGVR